MFGRLKHTWPGLIVAFVGVATLTGAAWSRTAAVPRSRSTARAGRTAWVIFDFNVP